LILEKTQCKPGKTDTLKVTFRVSNISRKEKKKNVKRNTKVWDSGISEDLMKGWGGGVYKMGGKGEKQPERLKKQKGEKKAPCEKIREWPAG